MSLQIKIPIEELQQRKLMVCTPMYGGQAQGMYTRSIADLSALCYHYKIPLKLNLLFNESLITRARNYNADEFMRSDCTHMMFIDSDIGFNPNDVIAMLALQNPDPSKDPYDILCGPYPKKAISWEKVKLAVDKGYADENPEELNRFVGDYVFNPVSGNGEIPLGEPAEVLESGTGFMMIRRNTFEKFSEAYPYQHYKPDHVRTSHFDGSREIVAYFDTPIDGKQMNLYSEMDNFLTKNPKATRKDILDFLKDPNKSSLGIQYSKRYLSEDYMFCRWTRNIGLRTWLCPWMQLQHCGMMIFGGSLPDLAAIGASATTDVSQLKKKK